MITIRRGSERGHARHGWLDSHHTFSFADYYDEKFMGFSDLRVINDDWVVGGAGFGTHPHRDMEIISYVLEGSIEHKDSMGMHERLKAGEVQVMSAGTGVRHSEYNGSATDKLNFLQIWIMPNQRGGEPRYAQKDFSGATGITLVVSPDGRNGSLPIRQDAAIHRIKLVQESAEFLTAPARVYYLQVARGVLMVNGTLLSAGDGAFIKDEANLQFSTEQQAEALLMDLRAD